MSTSTNPIVRFASFNLAVISLSCIGFSQTSQTAQTSEKKQLARAVVADTSCESEVRPIKRVNKLGKPIAADWTTLASTYTHDQKGQRVDQYALAVEPQSNERPDYVKSGFRSSRSTLQAGFSADHYQVSEQWGQSVRPYGEWRYPNRPFSVPYGQWGPQLPQVVQGGNQWNGFGPRVFNPNAGPAGQFANPNFNGSGNMNANMNGNVDPFGSGGGVVYGNGISNPNTNGNGIGIGNRGWNGNGNGFSTGGSPWWGPSNNGGVGGFGVGPGNVLPPSQDEYYQQAPTYNQPSGGFQSPFRN